MFNLNRLFVQKPTVDSIVVPEFIIALTNIQISNTRTL